MNTYILLSFFLLLTMELVNAFFYHPVQDDFESEKFSLLKNFNLEFSKQQTKSHSSVFPQEFTINIEKFGSKFNLTFIRIDNNNPIQSANIYVIDKNSSVPTKYENNNEDKFEMYSTVNGQSYGTLIQNQKNLKFPFRLLATIQGENNQIYDIMPIKIKESLNSRNFAFSLNNHAIIKKDPETLNYGSKFTDALQVPSEFQKKNVFVSTNRAVNGQPLNLYLETLVVTDISIFNDHSRFSGSTVQSVVFQNMRIYFAHLMNGVNSRYQNSFINDPDLRIWIRVVNFLFLTNPTDCAWADPALVGVREYPTYEGRQTVSANPSIAAFRNYMNSRNFPFSFDHAIGFFSKDLWNSSPGTPESRKGVVGYAYTPGVCGSFKYSIVEDVGYLNSIGTVAHEIAHNLNTQHDGDNNNCNPNEYIMAAVDKGFNPNSLLFSSCSIQQIKNYLLINNQGVSTEASCMINVPNNLAIDINLLNNRLPGQTWSANDQCKMIYNSNARFAQDQSNVMCSSLWCYTSPEGSSFSTKNIRAYDGTTCASGSWCINGVCTQSASAPVGNCLFGNDLITQSNSGLTSLPAAFMTCDQFFAWVISNNQSPRTYCSMSSISSICCNSCPKYNSISCFDSLEYCYKFDRSFCDGGILNGQAANQVCRRLCGTCPTTSVPVCSSNPCLNGGICQADSSLFLGYRCACANGYSGDICENKNPCLPNPCRNGGACQPLGSLGYSCICQTGYIGYDCNTCSDQSFCAGMTQQAALFCANRGIVINGMIFQDACRRMCSRC